MMAKPLHEQYDLNLLLVFTPIAAINQVNCPEKDFLVRITQTPNAEAIVVVKLPPTNFAVFCEKIESAALPILGNYKVEPRVDTQRIQRLLFCRKILNQDQDVGICRQRGGGNEGT